MKKKVTVIDNTLPISSYRILRSWYEVDVDSILITSIAVKEEPVKIILRGTKTKV